VICWEKCLDVEKGGRRGRLLFYAISCGCVADRSLTPESHAVRDLDDSQDSSHALAAWYRLSPITSRCIILSQIGDLTMRVLVHATTSP